MKMSSATKRALERNYYQSCEWFCDFKESDVEGIGYEPGVHRRDPSSVLKVGDLYYVWYTKSIILRLLLLCWRSHFHIQL